MSGKTGTSKNRKQEYNDTKKMPEYQERTTLRDKILELSKEGLYQSEIARKLGLSRQRINQCCKTHRIDVRKRISKNPYGYVRKSPPRVLPAEELIADYVLGMKVDAICSKYGIHSSRLYEVLNRHGVADRRKPKN